MINGEYGLECAELFDLGELQAIAAAMMRAQPGLTSLRARLSDYHYSGELARRLPDFFGYTMNVFIFPRGRLWPIHVDHNRNFALNIPVRNCGPEAQTVYYESRADMVLDYVPEKCTYLVRSPLRELYRFPLVVPTLIRTDIPHNVERPEGEDRITLSLSGNPNWSYAEARTVLEQELAKHIPIVPLQRENASPDIRSGDALIFK